MSENHERSSFSDHQARILAEVLDAIIPPSADGLLPGAGRIDLAGAIEDALRQTPEVLAMIVQGLSSLDELARRRGSQDFTALHETDRREVMEELASSQDAFPPVLILQTFAAYYRSQRVLEELGLEARAPHPSGYAVEPNNFALLDAVRRRPPFYRQC